VIVSVGVTTKSLGHAVAGDDLADLVFEGRGIVVVQLRGRLVVDIGREVDYCLGPERQRGQHERQGER